MSLRTKM